MPNWTKIKNEYISTKISQRKLAEKHGVNASVLMTKANKEKWAKKHKQIKSRVQAKTEEKIVEKLAEAQADYIIDIGLLNFKLSNKTKEYLEKEKNLNAGQIKDLATAIRVMKDIQTAAADGNTDNKPTININIPRGDTIDKP